jgi:hypothetical protein
MCLRHLSFDTNTAPALIDKSYSEAEPAHTTKVFLDLALLTALQEQRSEDRLDGENNRTQD